MPDALDFLGATTAVYTAGLAGWLREEKRLFGGDAVLTELLQFKGESDADFVIRKASADYTNFGEQHAATLAGHIQRVAPMPDLGALGSIRSRTTIQGQPTQAELIFYNVDGVGSDGSQWGAFWTGVQIRALATGHRWLLVEMPELPSVAATNGDATSKRQPTQADVLQGHRPYLVELAPSSVPYWEYTRGRLDCLIARVPVVPKGKKRYEVTTDALGYYLFTRKDFADFGTAYEGGGWWLFDSDKNPVSNGNWERTRGQIPIVPLYGMTSHGTPDYPAISRSLTMELGQLSVALMNLTSARDYDLIDGAMSVLYVLGAEAESFKLMVAHKEEGSKLVPVPGQMNPVTNQLNLPSLYDGSMGVVAAASFDMAIAALTKSAHEKMVRQVTSPDASGAARQTEFGENTSPLLAGIAARREQAENAVIFFLELRAGFANASGVVEFPKEFELAPILTKIERTMKRMTDSGVMSPTLFASLQERAAREDGTLPEDDADQKAVAEELLASAKIAASKQQGEAFKQWTDGGVPKDFAARQAGLSEQDAAELEPEEVPDELMPDPNAPPKPGAPIPNEKVPV